MTRPAVPVTRGRSAAAPTDQRARLTAAERLQDSSMTGYEGESVDRLCVSRAL